MSLTVILLLLAAGALILPNLGGDDDDGGKNQVDGTFGEDDLEGTEGNDLLRGFKGEDILNGLGGNDELLGGEDDDIINGGGGLDFIRGGPGNDTIDAGEGNDRVIGGADNDRIDGGFGSDIIRSGEGDDTIFGGFDSRLQDDGSVVANVSATDQINGEQGNDTIFIWGGDSSANGASGEDELILMTGTGTFLDEGSESNDFYAFGNLTDEQETLVIIDDFVVGVDTLTLTVDTSDIEDGDEMFFTVSVTNETIDGVEGALVSIVLDDESEDALGSDFEAASAFIVGFDDEDISGDDLNVVYTNSANLFDAEGSLADVKAGGVNVVANPVPVVPPIAK